VATLREELTTRRCDVSGHDPWEHSGPSDVTLPYGRWWDILRVFAATGLRNLNCWCNEIYSLGSFWAFLEYLVISVSKMEAGYLKNPRAPPKSLGWCCARQALRRRWQSPCPSHFHHPQGMPSLCANYINYELETIATLRE
jgi:hypothetical protein